MDVLVIPGMDAHLTGVSVGSNMLLKTADHLLPEHAQKAHASVLSSAINALKILSVRFFLKFSAKK